MVGNIVFEVPSQFAASILDGSAVRIGTLIKDTASGKVLAHVQETGLAQQLMSSGSLQPFSLPKIPTNPMSFVADAANLASSAYANVQLNHLTKLVENLQILQFANLGFTLAGIGVSAVGFAVVIKRLNRVEKSIAELSVKVDRKFQELYERELRHCFSRIQTLYDGALQTGHLINSARDWIGIEQKLAVESGILRAEIQHLLTQDTFSPDLFSQLIQALTLGNGVRQECLLRSNETGAAHHFALTIGDQYSELFDDLSANELARKAMGNYTGPEREEIIHFNAKKRTTTQIVQGCRDLTESALCRPLLISHLADRGITGGEYLDAISLRNEEGILLLKTG
jgi:hypothetical protein